MPPSACSALFSASDVDILSILNFFCHPLTINQHFSLLNIFFSLLACFLCQWLYTVPPLNYLRLPLHPIISVLFFVVVVVRRVSYRFKPAFVLFLVLFSLGICVKGQFYVKKATWNGNVT